MKPMTSPKDLEAARAFVDANDVSVGLDEPLAILLTQTRKEERAACTLYIHELSERLRATNSPLNSVVATSLESVARDLERGYCLRAALRALEESK